MKKIFIIMAALLLTVFTAGLTARAAGPLDEIKSYTITVDPRSDGSLDLKYQIDWLVLDSTSQGPLTWLKVGIPNSHADSITALTKNISKIGYLGENGSYVRIDFDRAYKAGETVTFGFSIHQPYMYRLNGTENTCSFAFVPGWFDETKVDSLKLLWNASNVTYSDSTGTDDGYLSWTQPLEPGQRLTAIVRYSAGTFATSPDMQATAVAQGTQYAAGGATGSNLQPYSGSQSYESSSYVVNQGNSLDAGKAVIIVIFLIIVIVSLVVGGGGGGRYRGGFWGGGHGGGHGGGGCACACAGCACACACAGGGRAGCSAKNFYDKRAAVPTDALRDKLQN